jgi:small-conductance mechanosensitive channel
MEIRLMRLMDIRHAPQLFYLARPGYFAANVIVYLFIPAALLVALALGYALRRLLGGFKARATTPWGDLALAVLKELPIPLLLLGAVYAILRVVVLPGRFQQAASKLIFAVVVVVIFYFINKVIVTLIRHLAVREPALARITQPAALVLRVLLMILATVIVLENLGVHLVAVWTTLGIGSVAVALGLQETLSNAFAGFYLMADQPAAPGDYVKLDTGHEGYVIRTGWRATSLRTLANNIVYIPNASLAKAVITNYSRPEERMALSIAVSVAYGTDPKHVEVILEDTARQAATDVAGLLADPPPSARLIPGFGASSLDFSLGVQVRRFVDQYLVQSELRKRIIERFSKEGIEMPFPTRTILLDPTVLESIRQSEGQ